MAPTTIKGSSPFATASGSVASGESSEASSLQTKNRRNARRCCVAWSLLRLPYQVKDLFLDWLQRNVHPSRAAHVESLIRQSRGGKLYNGMRQRHRGKGKIVEQISQAWDVFTRKYGLNRDLRPLNTKAFRRPRLHGQLTLFEHGV